MNTLAATRGNLFTAVTQRQWLVRALGALLFAALIGVGASIRVSLPWTPVPITFQTLFLFLGAALLGRHYAAQMVGWYLTLGLCGAPFFAGGAAGWAVLVGPTGGYLAGFLVAALWIGYGQSHVRGVWTQVGLFLSASCLLFACGASWLGMSLHLGFVKTLWAGVLPFVPGDLLKIALATVTLHGGRKFFSHLTH